MKVARDYQGKAIEAATEAMKKKTGRALIVMASGLGKTLAAAKFARIWWEMTGTRILFLVQIVDALKQGLTEFREEFEGSDTSFGFLAGGIQDDIHADFLFATFQTMQNYLEEFEEDEFGLIIVDESHHAQAESYREVLDWFSAEFYLAITATPERMDGRDIREIFGEEVYTYSLAEALADGHWLANVDYRVMFDNISIIALRRLVKQVEGGDRTVTKRQIDNTIFLKERLSEIVRIVKAEQEDGGKPTIIFCRSKSHLSKMHKYFPDAVPYHSGLKKNTLEDRLGDFKANRIQTLLVIEKLNEAVDIPHAELLVFLRATDSQTIWLQQLGRGLRRTNGKNTVVVLDFVANCNRLFTIKSFSDQIQSVAKRDELELETGWKVNFVVEAVDILRVLSRIGYRSWDDMFELLVKFKAEHEHCNVSQSSKTDEVLGTWVVNQRQKYRRGELSAGHIERLEQLGFILVPYVVRWDEMCGRLLKFKQEHGHCNVPGGWQKDSQLSGWVNNQRSFYNAGKLSRDRIKRLEDIGFVWKWRNARWQEMYAKLVAFNKAHGHCNVPIVDGELSFWCERQRLAGRANQLPQARFARLELIGFLWEDPRDVRWEKMFRKLVVFKKKHRHCNVPTADRELGSWIRVQRSSYKSGSLHQDRIDRLNAIGFVWRIL